MEKNIEQAGKLIAQALNLLIQDPVAAATAVAASKKRAEVPDEPQDTLDTPVTEVVTPEETDDSVLELPSSDDLRALGKSRKKADKEKLMAYATEIGLDHDDAKEMKPMEIAVFLAVLKDVEEGNSADDFDQAEIVEVCTVLDLPLEEGFSIEDALEKIKEVLTAPDEDEDEEDEESEEEEDSEEEEEESEEVDDDAPMPDFDDFPKKAEMKKRLAAYNAAAKKELDYELTVESMQIAYRYLVEKLSDDDGEIAEWGVPYSPDGDKTFCCGLECTETELDDDTIYTCQVTGKTYVWDDTKEDYEQVEFEADE